MTLSRKKICTNSTASFPTLTFLEKIVIFSMKPNLLYKQNIFLAFMENLLLQSHSTANLPQSGDQKISKTE